MRKFQKTSLFSFRKAFYQWNLFFWLYFCQGLPFGFFLNYLPLELREQGWSITDITLWSVLLGIPWSCKLLWSPLVERYYSPRLGRRRSWIFPLNLLLMITLIATGFVHPFFHLNLLIVFLFFINMISALQDIAVDGLAVSLLRDPQERGIGNAIQVVGYKFGMLTASTLVLSLMAFYQWEIAQLFMGLLILPMVFLSLFLAEDRLISEAQEKEKQSLSATPLEPEKTSPQAQKSSYWEPLRPLFQYQGITLLLIFISTYKVGESMVGSKYGVMLQDTGLSKLEVAHLLGFYGMIGSLLGSFAGGFALRYCSRFKALLWFSLGQGFFILALCFLVTLPKLPPLALRVVLTGENFLGGMVTTALFAFMMDFTSPRWGAAQYTLFANLEVFTKILSWVFSAYLAESLFGTPEKPDYWSMGIVSIFFLIFPLLLLPFLRKTPLYQKFIQPAPRA
jgi:PAT family beta-lactamase induction signal transducer AmpG